MNLRNYRKFKSLGDSGLVAGREADLLTTPLYIRNYEETERNRSRLTYHGQKSVFQCATIGVRHFNVCSRLLKTDRKLLLIGIIKSNT